MEVQIPYLLNQRGLIDEHHFWVNTKVPEDLAWIQQHCDACPDFFKLVLCPAEPDGNATVTLFYALPEYRKEDTIVIKVDDDIVFIAPNAIWNLLTFRLEHPEYFLVFANTVNNGWCDFLRQRMGLVANAPMLVETPAGGNAWASGVWAEAMHRSFLTNLGTGDLQMHEQAFRQFMTVAGERVSINFVCWLGEDMAQLNVEGEDEHFLCNQGPRELMKVNAICGGAVVSHYAFFPQRDYLDGTDVLKLYRSLAIREPVESLAPVV